MQQQQSEQPLTSGITLAIKITDVLGFVPRMLRYLRGHRCDTLLTKFLGCYIALFTWMMGGGGDLWLLRTAIFAFLLLAVATHLSARAALRNGRLASSQFIGLPLVCRTGWVSPATGYYVCEPVQWLLLAAFFSVIHEPGWCFTSIVWACTCWVEVALVDRRDETQTFDHQDAHYAGSQAADRIRSRIGE